MASRKEEKERRRRERLERERQDQERARRRRLYSVVAGGGLAVAAVAAIVIAVAAGGGDSGKVSGKQLEVASLDPPAQKTTDLEAAAKQAGCTLSNPPIEGRTHTTEAVNYKTNPPSSGPHNPQPAADGTYAQSPGKTNLVHTLEHGRIVVQFRPSLRPKRVRQLKGLFDEDTYHVVLTPNSTKMPYQVAVVAWGHIAGCKRITDGSFDVIRAFTDRYRDKAPEFVP